MFALEELPEAAERPAPPAVDPAEDLVVLPFSSGTTGLSKGVMLTHRNLVRTWSRRARCTGSGPTTR